MTEGNHSPDTSNSRPGKTSNDLAGGIMVRVEDGAIKLGYWTQEETKIIAEHLIDKPPCNIAD
jgi:hypothetical protein